MGVRMTKELLAPSVETRGEARHHGFETFCGSELFTQGRGDRSKEEVEGFFGLRLE